jgi:uncharacterized protein YukE
VTDTPNAPTPTTPATAEQLRKKAQRMRDIAENCDRQHAPVSASDWREAAAALDAEAARREAGTTAAEQAVDVAVTRLHGIADFYADTETQKNEALAYACTIRAELTRLRAAVRLTTEGAE